jgi:hypothetical protein
MVSQTSSGHGYPFLFESDVFPPSIALSSSDCRVIHVKRVSEENGQFTQSKGLDMIARVLLE